MCFSLKQSWLAAEKVLEEELLHTKEQLEHVKKMTVKTDKRIII